MQKHSSFFRSGILSTLALLLALFFPVSAYAATTADCTPPSGTGVHVPTGSSAATYAFNCDTNLWENAHFTYDPATGVTTPKDPVVYTYNNTTGKWDASVWQYVTSQGAYQQITLSVSQPPAGAQTVGGPPPAVSTSTPADNQSTVDPTTQAATTSTGGTGGTNTVNTGNTTGINSSNNTGLAVGNALAGTALTGNATVFGNTTAGGATSGNAQDMANVINMLQSSTSAFGIGGNAVTFVSNINGDVNGDLLLDPASLSQIQPAGSSTDINNSLKVNAANDVNAAINNDVNLAAQSGNATVSSNTTAGDATSGNASAVANIINMINSVVGSGKSFLGVININGNLNGDILLPPNFVDQLLASNTPSASVNTADLNTANSVTALNNINQAINNNVSATANTGAANVSQNTNAGNATTGNASTNVTIFNLTGSNVIGTNDLLVFVNVLGKWVGMIVNAPAGATAAELGGNISANSSTDVALNNNVNQGITNNVNVAAQSGDASVTRNTTAGNATSGNANAAVNILNMTSSSLNLANWFGVLFINVFGSWNGSFGVNTSAGDPVVAPSTPAASGSGSQNGQIRVFRFVASPSTGGSGGSGSTVADTSGAVLAAHTDSSTGSKRIQPVASNTTPAQQHANYWISIVGGSIAILMLTAERVRSIRRPNQ